MDTRHRDRGLCGRRAGKEFRHRLSEPYPRGNFVQRAAYRQLFQQNSAMLSEFPPELLESMPLVATGIDKSDPQSFLRIVQILHTRWSRETQRLPSPRISGHPANGVLIQKDPCFRRSDGYDGDPYYVRCCIFRRLRNLFGSFSISNRVSVAMDKEQVEFGLGGEYNSYLPLQHRFSTVARITNVGQCDCRPDHFRRAAVRQQPLEVRNQRSVRSSLTQKEKTNQSVVHEGLVVYRGKRSCTPSGGCK